MNLGRFHAAVHALRQEYESGDFQKLLANLQSTLQTSISQPTLATTQAFKEHYTALIDALYDAESNKAHPTKRKIFEEIGASGYIGLELSNRIAKIFSVNQMSPANALVEIQRLTERINQFFQRIIEIDNAFSELNIEREELKPGEFEVGISIPKNIIGSDLQSLEKEFEELDFSLKTLQEVAGGDAGSIPVKSISSSEWQMYLDVAPTMAAGLAVAVERIVALYKSLLEIKTLKKGLEEKQVPEAVLKSIQEHMELTIRNEIRKVAEELVDQYYKKNDEGRKNELKTQTSQALRYIADRIDRGATIEVRAKPPAEPTTDENNALSEKDKQKYSEIMKAALFVNEKATSTALLTRSDQPVLAIEYDKKDE